MFDTPMALVWGLSVPVLIWLWRFATSRHETRIPSLAPFAHLLRRPPTKRTRLFVNLLFWLQLAALIGLTLGAAQPMLTGSRVRNVLVILDTSASMNARQAGPSAFEQAKGYVQSRMLNPLRAERVMLVTTAPLHAPTPQPVSDRGQLINLIDRARVAEAGGQLAVARRLGQALMGGIPDETIVVTDEPAPEQTESHVSFRSFGRPLPNVAIVGAESYEPLCEVLPSEARGRVEGSPVAPTDGVSQTEQGRVVVAVQNFSDRPQAVSAVVRAQGGGQTRATVEVPAGARIPLTLDVPPRATGTLEVRIDAAHDAMDVDNRIRLTRHAESTHVLVASSRPSFSSTVSRWLEACSGIRVSQTAPDALDLSADVLITDDPATAASWSSAALVVAPPSEASPASHRVPGSARGESDRGTAQPRVRVSRWWLDPSHPLSNYLQPLEPVAAATAEFSPTLEASEPVVWAIRDGQRQPLAWGAESNGRRTVMLAADPTATPKPGPMLIVVLNGLRWLMASTESAGDHANFLDPVESNTWTRASTWEVDDRPAAQPAGPVQASRVSLTTACLMAVLGLLLVEWWRYSRKGARR